MQNCLIILNPRIIPECLDSLQSLQIDHYWLTGFVESQLAEPINDFISSTDYDNYLLASDDLIVTQEALDVVEGLLERHEQATGYCRIADDSPYYNVCRSSLGAHSEIPSMDDYNFYTVDEIDRRTNPHFNSWFGGWTLTGMRRDRWLANPFVVHDVTGIQSDYATCLTLMRPFACHKDARCIHVREEQHNIDTSRFIVGKVTPSVTHETKSTRVTVEHPELQQEESVVLSALASSVPLDPALSITPVLHDKRFPDIWCPGINLDSPQARNIVVALPLWERSGRIAHNYAGNADGTYDDIVTFANDELFGTVPVNTSGANGTQIAHVPFDPSIAVEGSALGYTASVFVRIDDNIQNITHVLSRQVIGDDNGGWRINIDENGERLEVEWVGGNGGVTDGTELQCGEWYHLCLTVLPIGGGEDGWAGILYINGIKDSSDTFVAAPVDLTAGDFMVGSRYSTTSADWSNALIGAFADARLYNRGLTAGEVWQIAHFPEDLYRPPEAAKLYVDPSVYHPSGGLVIGGVLNVDYNISVTPVGGAIAGGSAAVGGSTTHVAEGGALAGGSSTPSLQRTESVSGGVLFGGMGIQIITVLPSGGMELGGNAEPSRILFVTPTGGVEMGQGLYAVGREYRLTITVPAGNVSADLTNFPLGVTTGILPLTATAFLFTDVSDNTLSSEVVNFNSSNGRLYAFVRTDIAAASDTVLYLYFDA